MLRLWQFHLSRSSDRSSDKLKNWYAECPRTRCAIRLAIDIRQDNVVAIDYRVSTGIGPTVQDLGKAVRHGRGKLTQRFSSSRKYCGLRWPRRIVPVGLIDGLHKRLRGERFWQICNTAYFLDQPACGFTVICGDEYDGQVNF